MKYYFVKQLNTSIYSHSKEEQLMIVSTIEPDKDCDFIMKGYTHWIGNYYRTNRDRHYTDFFLEIDINPITD